MTWVLSEVAAGAVSSGGVASSGVARGGVARGGRASGGVGRQAGAGSASSSLGEAVLAGLATGRTSISADRNGPVLLRLGDELLALDADGTILADASGRRRVVRGPRASFPAPAEPGPNWLEDHETAVLALCG